MALLLEPEVSPISRGAEGEQPDIGPQQGSLILRSRDDISGAILRIHRRRAVDEADGPPGEAVEMEDQVDGRRVPEAETTDQQETQADHQEQVDDEVRDEGIHRVGSERSFLRRSPLTEATKVTRVGTLWRARRSRQAVRIPERKAS